MGMAIGRALKPTRATGRTDERHRRATNDIVNHRGEVEKISADVEELSLGHKENGVVLFASWPRRG